MRKWAERVRGPSSYVVVVWFQLGCVRSRKRCDRYIVHVLRVHCWHTINRYFAQKACKRSEEHLPMSAFSCASPAESVIYEGEISLQPEGIGDDLLQFRVQFGLSTNSGVCIQLRTIPSRFLSPSATIPGCAPKRSSCEDPQALVE